MAPVSFLHENDITGSMVSPLLVRLGVLDRRILLAFVSRRRPLLDLLMRGVTRLADWPVAVGLTTALALGAIPALQQAGVRAAWTLVVSHASVEVLKRVFTRERPRLPVGLDWLVTVPDRFSFPSGHATAGFAMALPVAMALPPSMAAPVMALGIAVGFSRCYLGVHYPGDVVAGWSLSSLTLGALILLGF